MWKAKRPFSGRRNGSRGFATVEVLVTVAIVILIGSISILAFGRSDRAALQDDVAGIALALQQARLEAAETGRSVAVEFDADDGILRAGRAEHTLSRGVSSTNETTRLQIRPSGENEGLALELVAGEVSRIVELDWLTGQIRLSQ
ncbi:Tfp pilus assembly protein FimT/FimU [Yoonia sp. BS5-3]|uniref:Tfp pilus assembly protein FimT/FimU n=1 Tax=Yoonia phaeophyticola TaxID=3137369 RepID=A0ABZ2V6C5_9RHOB